MKVIFDNSEGKNGKVEGMQSEDNISAKLSKIKT